MNQVVAVGGGISNEQATTPWVVTYSFVNGLEIVRDTGVTLDLSNEYEIGDN